MGNQVPPSLPGPCEECLREMPDYVFAVVQVPGHPFHYGTLDRSPIDPHYYDGLITGDLASYCHAHFCMDDFEGAMVFFEPPLYYYCSPGYRLAANCYTFSCACGDCTATILVPVGKIVG